MDVTAVAIGVTVGLGVGIIVLLIAIAVHYKSRRRVEQLRQLITSNGQRQTSTTSRIRLSDDVKDILRDRRRRSAENETIGFEYFINITYIGHRHRRYYYAAGHSMSADLCFTRDSFFFFLSFFAA